MNNRAIIPLIIGAVVGLVAIKLSIDVVKRARASTTTEDLVRVVVAKQMIPVGAEIKESMISVAKTSRTLAPKGIFSDPKKVVGRVTKAQIPRGVPVIEEMLAPPGTPPGMASLVPPGYRAVAVKVDEYSSVGGFIKPGCRVDVAAVMTVRSPEGRPETISKVILQNVLVGAVGQSLTGDDKPDANLSRSVTLLVKPEEVPILHLAASKGVIRLALRHYEDGSPSPVEPATDDQLLGQEGSEKQKADQPPDGGKQGGGLFGKLLAGLLKPRTPQQRVPQFVGAVQKKTEPFVVMLMQGDEVETITFKDESSVCRLATNKQAGSAGAAQPGALPVPGVAQQFAWPGVGQCPAPAGTEAADARGVSDD